MSKGKKPEIEIHSIDPDAAFYRCEPGRRDDDSDERAGKGKIGWGHVATLAVSGPDEVDGEVHFPNLVVGVAVLDKPDDRIGYNGARVLANIHARGYPAGYLGADRAYSSAKQDDFQLPALALGYQPVYDYRIDQLGVKAEHGGFLQIEGACTPRPSSSHRSMPPWISGRAASTRPPTVSVWRSAGSTGPGPRGNRIQRAMSGSSARPPIPGPLPAVR